MSGFSGSSDFVARILSRAGVCANVPAPEPVGTMRFVRTLARASSAAARRVGKCELFRGPAAIGAGVDCEVGGLAVHAFSVSRSRRPGA